MVQRLDESTSGVMLYPLSPVASSSLSKVLRQRHCEKVYEAVVDTRALPGEVLPEEPVPEGAVEEAEDADAEVADCGRF